MESPIPEAVLPGSKLVDSPLEKETKPGVNGQSYPAESTPESRVNTEEPVANGGESSKDKIASNGVATADVNMGNGDDVEAPKSVDTEDHADITTNSNVGEANEKPQVIAKPSKDDSPNGVDTEMNDAGPSDEIPEPAQVKRTEAPSARASSVPKDTISKESSSASPAPAGADTEGKSEKSPSMSHKPSPFDAALSTAEMTTHNSEIDVQPASLSQLAIDSTEAGTSPVESSVEVSMTDAPTVKIAREREDDTMEEPAPKRAKTEPKEDVSSQPVPLMLDSGTLDESPKPRFDEFHLWKDPEHRAWVISPYRKRELRRSVARVKKTKSGGQFRDSVQRLWPTLWDKYSARIDKPMDLSEIDRRLRDDKYQTFGDFQDDLALIVENSQLFNGAMHDVTKSARAACKSVWDDISSVPEDEPAKPKPPPKVKPPRESRTTNFNGVGQSDGHAASPTAVSAPVAKPTQAVTDSRRASIVADADRPKRTVRAPKSKDIDYSSKPSRRKLKPELQFCDEVLTELMHTKHFHLNQWFLDAVDAEGLGIPEYYKTIKHPMDLGKISRMLTDGAIDSAKDFSKNVKLMFDNCYLFNGSSDLGGVSAVAKQLQDIYTSQMERKNTWLANYAKTHLPPPSVSNASDDEDEEEEEEDVDESPLGPDPTSEVRALEVRLREEMEKQTNLFAAESPNQSMIEIQQEVVNMVQRAILKAKKALNEYRQKHGAGKPSKKSKPNKSKPSGGGGAARKVAGSAALPKKVSGAPSKKKKNLTAADKDHIANAINDLEGHHLDRAIDIIKRDTGQMESDDGELELDIDQLSSEAMLKLWELCKRVLPGFGKDPSQAHASSPEASRGAAAKKAPPTAAKPKKNKPMSAQEQEARIAQLKEIRGLYGPGRETEDHTMQASPMHDSSDDSSEEE